jgi:ABC-2 type transport system ATP-binding protein
MVKVPRDSKLPSPGVRASSRARQSRAAIGVVNQEVVADPFFTPRESLEVQAGMYGVPP